MLPCACPCACLCPCGGSLRRCVETVPAGQCKGFRRPPLGLHERPSGRGRGTGKHRGRERDFLHPIPAEKKARPLERNGCPRDLDQESDCPGGSQRLDGVT